MSKALFRWLRGELNGYYINNINQSCNEYAFYIHSFFGERSGMQFEHDKIDNKDLQGLGKFAGVFQLTQKAENEFKILFPLSICPNSNVVLMWQTEGLRRADNAD